MQRCWIRVDDFYKPRPTSSSMQILEPSYTGAISGGQDSRKHGQLMSAYVKCFRALKRKVKIKYDSGYSNRGKRQKAISEKLNLLSNSPIVAGWQTIKISELIRCSLNIF